MLNDGIVPSSDCQAEKLIKKGRDDSSMDDVRVELQRRDHGRLVQPDEKRKTRNGRLSQADRLLIFDAAEKSKSKLIIELVRLSLFIIDMVSQNISQQKDYDVMKCL